MTLWSLLWALCIGMAAGGASAAATQAQVGPLGQIVAILLGAMIGTSAALIMHLAGRGVVAFLDDADYSEDDRVWPLRVLYIMALLWGFMAIFFGEWVAGALLRIGKH